MSQRVCRACGRKYEHPVPGVMSTKRFCEACQALPEPIRDVLEKHGLELTRLRREVDRLKKAAPPGGEPA